MRHELQSKARQKGQETKMNSSLRQGELMAVGPEPAQTFLAQKKRGFNKAPKPQRRGSGVFI